MKLQHVYHQWEWTEQMCQRWIEPASLQVVDYLLYNSPTQLFVLPWSLGLQSFEVCLGSASYCIMNLFPQSCKPDGVGVDELHVSNSRGVVCLILLWKLLISLPCIVLETYALSLWKAATVMCPFKGNLTSDTFSQFRLHVFHYSNPT